MGITESLVLSERAHFFRPAPNPPPELGALIQRAEQSLIVNRSFSGHFRSVRLPGFGIGFVPYPLSFPKGLKIFPRSGSVTPLSLPFVRVRSLAPRGSKMRPMLSPNSSASLLISESAAAPPPQTSFARRRIHTLPVAADLIYLAAGRATQILRCQIEFAVPRRRLPC